jgi:hypothetical protein
MLDVHDVLMAAPAAQKKLQGINRFLGVNDDNQAAVIRIDNGFTTRPVIMPFDELLEALRNGHVYVVKNCVIEGLPISEDQLSKRGRRQFKKNQEVILPSIVKHDLIFDEAKRAEIFKKWAKSLNRNIKRVHRLYYRLLGYSMNKFALAPNFCKRGGVQTSMVRRRGTEFENKVPLSAVRDELEDGVIKFLLPGKNTIQEAYVKTLKKHFGNGKNPKDKDGKTRPLDQILVHPSLRPSLRQFEHVYLQMRKNGQQRTKLPRHARPPKPKKAKMGTARDLIRGPGYLSEIDSTGLQIPLVSRFGRSLLIGQPTLYFVIDNWSGVITGYVISLQGAGWALAAKALKNCFQDKGKVFKRLNLDHTSDEWPCHHLPSRIAADRGEMKNLKPEILVSAAGITIQIGPPMQPEWRAIVESTFKNIKHGDFYRIAGRHPKFPKRGEPDGKNTAALTLEELEIIIVEKILDLNNDPAPEKIVPAEMMEDPNAKPSRIEMYKWGLEHRPGYTRTMSDRDVFTLLLTRAKASVTSYGIYFNGVTYVSKRLLDNGMLARAANSGRFPIEIAYDEHHADLIWFYDSLLDDWVFADNSNEEVRRKKISFYEQEVFKKDLRKRIRATKNENIHIRDEKSKWINKMTRQAVKQAKLAKMGKSKTELVNGIEKNRKFERDYENALGAAETIFSYGQSIKSAREDGRRTLKQVIKPEKELAEDKPESVSKISKESWED